MPVAVRVRVNFGAMQMPGKPVTTAGHTFTTSQDYAEFLMDYEPGKYTIVKEAEKPEQADKP